MIRLFTCLLSLTLLATATISIAGTDINFRGTLINLTCKVGDDKPIDINFGDEVVTDIIDGKHYMQSVPLKIICSQDYSGDLNFSVKGLAASFDTSAIQTSVADLGIRLLNASTDQPLEVNKSYPHKNKDQVDIKVVPVKKAGADLSGGVFTASAEILVEPQ